MKFTLNQLKVELKAVQAAHGMLSPGDFFWGDPSRAWEEKTLKYPLMCCYTAGTGGQMQERLTGVSLVVMIADKVYKDYKSLDDTESDTLNVSRQVFNVINKSGRWRKLLTVRSATATKFIDKGDDEITVGEVAAWAGTITWDVLTRLGKRVVVEHLNFLNKR
jgi:hypothetical protein